MKRQTLWLRGLVAAFIVAMVVACGGCAGDDDDHAPDDGSDDDTGDDDGGDDTSVDDDTGDDTSADDDLETEPPINPYLADSPWPMAHRNPYCQASSPLRGPEAGDTLEVDHLLASPVPAFSLYSPADAQGRRAVWTTTLFNIYTIDASATPLVELDHMSKHYDFGATLAGEYTILDADNTFYVTQADIIHAFSNQDPADVHSPIVELDSAEIPDPLPDEAILGINLLYDGMIAFATTAGRVGVMSRDFSESQVIQLSGDSEGLYNSIAADEDGGIYVVTTRRMYRIQWTGTELTRDEAAGAWSAPYEHGPDELLPGRISIGSGTTPTLVGFGDQDKFVAICDGRDVMRMVLFWRDRIPDDWEPIAPGADPRIAAEVPVDFGDPDVEFTSTEQSLLVRGYDIAAVNNYYGPHAIPGVFGALFSNRPGYAPYGAQKFRWDPASRTLNSVWVNPTVSCPNSVPTMSEASGLMYCVGQRNIVWTLEAIDWETGESAFYRVLGDSLKYNSFFAATEIGPDRNILNGAVYGVMDVRPAPGP